MKRVGLYFGSFNPIHLGHLIVAEHFASLENIDEVWFVVSPQNPLKSSNDLAPESDRLNMVDLAIENNNKLFSCDIEFSLSRPSYTATTLLKLSELYPNITFSLILGNDIVPQFHLWKNFSWILEHYEVLLYPRVFQEIAEDKINWNSYRVSTASAPRIEISSTEIRRRIALGLSVRYMVPKSVIDFISEHKLYQK